MKPILYEDEHWLAVDKPTGISTHGAFPGDVAMQEWLELHLSKQTFVCSRLDKGTSGVLLLAKTADASGRAQRIHEDDSSEKEYVFISAERAKEREWTCAEPLDGMSATTRFRFIRELSGRYLYAANISRGRTHQIRRHAALSHVPIAGDSEYGGVSDKRLFLHCQKVRWPEIASIIESPIPESFLAVEPFLRDVNSALERRGGWLAQVTDAWRMVHRGELSLDCAIDCYGAYALVWDYSSNLSDHELSETLQPVMSLLLSRFQLKGWILKRAKRNPHGNRLVQTQMVFGEPPPASFEVTEHNLRYRVTLTEAQHVGLFLDQRDNRKKVYDLASGRRVANLFAYTCSFSTVAAAGGAEVVFSVDVARKYLDQGCANFELNSLVESRRGKFIAEDVRSWLARQKRKVERDGDGARLGIVICDPPTFSTTQTVGEFSVEEEWLDLAKDCSFLLTNGGVAFFSTNHRAGERANYEAALRKVFSSVERRSPPMDFPSIPGEPEHVKLFVCRNS
jgi:23S rRNA G2069 N7-methylase RlmK/C1962 C5-methylase RlmI